MNRFRSRFLWLLLSCTAACSATERDEGQWPLSRAELERGLPPDAPGAATYRRYCIGCHGADGRGNGGLTGADLTLSDGPLATKDDATLIASVRDGKRGERATMPAHRPVLSDAQLKEVVTYVQQRFGPSAQAEATRTESAASSTGSAR